MKGSENPPHPILDDLTRAAASWVDEGDERRLVRWLARELDADGVPIRLAVPDWQHALALLAAARRARGEWPSGSVEALHGLTMAALRFSRADGNLALATGEGDGSPPIWASPDWLRWFRGTGIARVLNWWRDDRAQRTRSVTLPSPEP